MITRNLGRKIRRIRVRKKIVGTAKRPRLCCFRSNRFIYVQLINDGDGKTIASSSDLKIKKGTAKEKAEQVGIDIAKKAANKKVNSVVFDRGGYKYTGIVKILCEAARKQGLKF